MKINRGNVAMYGKQQRVSVCVYPFQSQGKKGKDRDFVYQVHGEY